MRVNFSKINIEKNFFFKFKNEINKKMKNFFPAIKF